MKRWTKRVMSVGMAAMMCTMMFAGCGGDSSEASNGTLNLFIWTEYVPESVIASFEEETGIKTNVSYYSSNEDLYAKMQSESEGTYDVILPSDYMVEKMSAQDMLEELDTGKLENLSNISEQYLGNDYDPENTYSVPYMGGVAAIAVNKDKVTTPIESYGDLFSEELKGQEVVLDDSRAVIGMTAKSLGYSMSTSDSAELEEISEKLMTLKDNVKVYDSDSPKSVLISGDCSVGMVWSAEIAMAMDENPDIEIVYPSEGAYVFLDNWCIPKGAKNTDQAMQFIDYMLSADASAACSEELPYLNPNQAACEQLGEEYLGNIAKNPPAEVIEKGEWIHNLDTDVQAVYEDMWTKLKK